MPDDGIDQWIVTSAAPASTACPVFSASDCRQPLTSCMHTCRQDPVPLPAWVGDYARRRYGPETPDSALQAWGLLLSSVYNATDSHTDHSRDITTSRPGTPELPAS